MTGPGGISRVLTSTRGARWVLAFLALTAAAASVVPQGEGAAYYRAHYGPVLGSIITCVGLHRAFTSWWFVAAETWLAASLAACAWQRLRLLRQSGPASFGLAIMHVGLLLALVSLILLPFVSREDYREASTGDTVVFDALSRPLVLTVDEFTVDYYPDLQPRQFITRARVGDVGGENRNAVIAVNRPFKQGCARIYQFDWGWLLRGMLTVDGGVGHAVSFEAVSGRTQVIEEADGFSLMACFLPDCVSPAEGMPYSRSSLPRNPKVFFVLFLRDQPVGMGLVSPGEKAAFSGGSVVFEEYRRYTGLMAKENPVEPVILTGFGLTVTGLALYYGFPRRGGEAGRGPDN